MKILYFGVGSRENEDEHIRALLKSVLFLVVYEKYNYRNCNNKFTGNIKNTITNIPSFITKYVNTVFIRMLLHVLSYKSRFKDKKHYYNTGRDEVFQPQTTKEKWQ